MRLSSINNERLQRRAIRAAALALMGACLALLVPWSRQTLSEKARLRAMEQRPGSAGRLELFRRAVALDPGNGRARALLSGECLAQGRIDEAEAEAGRAVASFNSPEFMLQRASIARRRNEPARALAMLESARLMRPDSPEVLTQLAATYSMDHQYESARRVAEALNLRDPDNPDALYILSLCAEASNKTSLARSFYARAGDRLRQGRKSALQISIATLDDRAGSLRETP